jgi:hypothetical protein
MPKKVTVQYLTDYTYSQLLTTDQHSFMSDQPAESGQRPGACAPIDCPCHPFTPIEQRIRDALREAHGRGR